MDKQPDDIPEYEGIKTRYVLYIIFAVTALLVGLAVINGIKPITFAVYNTDKVDYYLEHMDKARAMYNEESDKLPSLFRVVFGDEKINSTLVRQRGEEINLAIETDNGRIKSINMGEMAEPTMQLRVKEDTLLRISGAENAADELEEALDNGEIDYETERARSAVKMAAVRATVQVWSWFT